jgi:hypothetical protein
MRMTRADYPGASAGRAFPERAPGFALVAAEVCVIPGR